MEQEQRHSKVRISHASKEELEKLNEKLGPPGRKFRKSYFAYSFYCSRDRPHKIINRRGELAGWTRVSRTLNKKFGGRKDTENGEDKT